MTASHRLALIQRASEMISAARYVVAFTGAGISTPSGIPDFRGEKSGLWQRYDPMQVASRSAFFHSPTLFFDWFRPLFMTSWDSQPNDAHHQLSALEKQGLLKSIITQNIDGLHKKAGSQHVLELHGTALTFSCPKCLTSVSGEEVFSQFSSGNPSPYCANCSGILKPDVVLFEESLPQDIWDQAQNEADKADLMFVIGSSLEVYPANSIPQAAMRHGCKLIFNNLSRTPMDEMADLCIPMDTAEFFPLLMTQLIK
ncbi:MAG: RNA polymerase subunit sigma [Chloroflexi bacterium HGW-Chloroflexi-5]|jgi:NAD-dependent deacetylase|nr:MAG: RNA polymerase subunit sigma [Chloroflexi bacterium HGW-Chloroflexi-5]